MSSIQWPGRRWRGVKAAADAEPTGLRAALRGQGGSAALEFAIVCPLLALMLFGILIYGGYFLISHSVQQIANDCARASIVGLDDAERRQLAGESLASELTSYAYLQPSDLQLAYTAQGRVVTVQIAYDGSANPLWSLRGLVPMPASTVVRSASVQLGGY